MNLDYKNSDIWGNTTPENFRTLVPDGAWLTREECQKIISFLKMPVEVFEVGQDAEWAAWVAGSMAGQIPERMLPNLRGPTGKGYKSGCLAPFLAWTWAWHGEYVESASFLSLIGGMFFDTSEVSDVVDGNLLLADVAYHLDAMSVVKNVTALCLGAALQKAGLLRNDVFAKSALWDRSPALHGHLKRGFSLDGDLKMSSITSMEQQNTRGFLAALVRDLPWLLACVFGYLLSVESGNLDKYQAKLRQQFRSEQDALVILEELSAEVGSR